MKNYKLPSRKPDLLDELNALRKKRGIAYRAGNIEELEMIHLDMKAFWLKNGWNIQEAEEQYKEHVEQCQVPFVLPLDTPQHKYAVFDYHEAKLSPYLTLAELSEVFCNDISASL